MNKDKELLKLSKLRQQTRYNGYTSIGDYQNGIWECDFVSPYSKSSHNSDSDILVFLQDWCSSDSFNNSICQETLRLGYTPNVRTNVNLKNLLKKHFKKNLEDIYSTNLFPYIKPGSMSAKIPAADLYRAAKQFAVPMIDIVQPKIVICLGKETFNALRKACGLKVVYSIDEGINSDFMYKKSRIFCQCHTSQQAQNKRNRGGINRVDSDWVLMNKEYLLM
ncbi:uracil-DNA glycosylase family protein [Desulfobotulus mexicanus]|uniref:Uracil-DNA glycosylase-like domain-containing protein n=1 Tax=Desulfobotulus mexicanus TaxID=2586642 RepID=A0A5S5MES0_9BACT|nr:uracil-DNA glycosylase family protein [Desulfobotulus mexicanus]TYT74190.1 hypothetical protein FIM25_11440 [Desulfobotulus mexicanus]